MMALAFDRRASFYDARQNSQPFMVRLHRCLEVGAVGISFSFVAGLIFLL
jgi:hypothetical protein